MKILYIDKKSESKEIVNNLLEWEHDVRWVDCLYQAKTQILSHDYDLLITEVDLDDGNGLDFVEEIKQNTSIKVIVISANNEPKQLLKAIEINVEKYITKPVDEQELKTSIENFFSTDDYNKTSSIKKQIELSKGFTYDKEKKQIITKDASSIVLTQQELTLVQKLIEQNGLVCSHDTLQIAIGVAGESATIDTLRTVVRKIRKKTYEDIIGSISGFGYKIDIKSSQEKQDISSLVNIKSIDKKVLLVKANERKSATLELKLSQYGLNCEQVFLLKDAKEALKHEHFDYIIVDLQLPDGDGAELIRDKKSMESNKFIILSDSEDMHYKEYLYFKGIVDYIEKNDDLDYLAYTIYQTISKIESNQTYNNILIVESSKKIAEQIKDILLPRNYQVDIVSSPTKVINLIKHKSYNLIIMDLELDGVNSLEFLISLKIQVDKAMPIIMLSGEHRSYSVVRECYVKGAVECLRKPIFAEEFILKVDQWTEYYKQTLEIKDKQRLLSSYKNIVDKTVIVSKTDTDGIITYVNNMFCSISGYSKEELIGQPHNIIRHHDSKDSIFKTMWDTISKDKEIWHGVLKNKRSDGTHYIVDTYIMPILDYNNNVIEYIALRNDITKIEK